MWVVRDKDGTLKMSFEKPIRCSEWDNNKKHLYWGLAHDPKVNASNKRSFPEHQIIIVPKSEDVFLDLTWKDEPIKIVFGI